MLLALLCAQSPLSLPPLPLSVASELHGLRTFDADADGDLDLLVTIGASAIGADAPLALIRQGPNGFERATPLFPSVFPGTYDIGDLDADGDLDIALRSAEGELVLALNDGSGSFTTAVHGPVGAIIAAPCIVDLDDDGDLDVLYSTDIARATWAENLAAGVFAAGRPVDLGTPMAAAWAADLDGDGITDLVVGRSNEVRAVRNLGGLQFDASAQRIQEPGTVFDGVAAVDLDGAGSLDLVLSNDYGTSMVVLDVLGSVTEVAANLPTAVPYDVDLDGDLDVVLDGAAPGLEYLEADGTGGFAAAQPIPITGALFARELLAADVDADGRDDLLTPERWLRGLPTATGGIALEGTTRIVAQRAGRSVSPLALDVEGDGDIDLVAAATIGTSVVVERTGPFEYAPARTLDIEVPGEVVAFDFDGDGLGDLVGLRSATELGWQRNLGGTFGPYTTIDTGASVQITALEVDDLDGDGAPEVVFLAEAGVGTPHRMGSVEWSGTGFGPPTTLATFAGAPLGFILADIDLDGNIDASVWLTTPSSPGRIVHLRGAAAGTFGTRTILGEGNDTVLSLNVLDEGVMRLAVVTTHELREFRWNGVSFSSPITSSTLDIDGVDRPVLHGTVGRFFPDAPSPYGTLFVADGKTWLQGFYDHTVLEVGPASSDRPRVMDVDADGDSDAFLFRSGRRAVLYRNAAFDLEGVVYCGAGSPNSTGAPGRLLARGNPAAANDTLELVAYDLPVGQTALFLTSETGGFVPGAGGAAGTLCLGGQIGRFTAPGQIGTVNGDGSAYLDLDLQALPQPTGSASAMAGDLWRFQCWYRDGAGSNLTEAIAVSIL